MAMSEGLWRRAEELFHAALERPAPERAAFLEQACGGDAELRQKVAELVLRDAQAGSFLEKPALAGREAAADVVASLVGRELGPYRIVSLLGAGGMGEVYRAHDVKLGRDVAIKTLPPAFAGDPVRLARFRREARIVASLNHPNIAAIYGLEEAEGVDYLVLELVDGDMLQGPLAVGAVIDCARQLADALEAAHEHGIIHRDLKPANVKVTRRGVVKVLDFGVAKSMAAAADAAQAGAMTTAGTLAGHIVGTPGYMSPEQARGAEVDQRTDIWAFGCLLYELLTGKQAFQSGSLTETIAAVLARDPDWRALPADTPSKLRGLLRECLQKDPALRTGRITDARVVLQGLSRQRARSPRAAGRLPAARERRAAAGRIEALAVLPLANLARDPEQEYFTDGMTEALIAELAQIRALRVISRTSAMHYKGTTKTLPEIARELRVDAVVEGSVMRAGERVRVSAQLIDAVSDRHLWARSYERDLRDILALQTEVARAVAEEIQVALTPQEEARLARARPVNVEAHEAYIRGRYYYGRVQPDKSIEHFQRAIALQPDFALPHAGLADALCMTFGAVMEKFPPTQLAPRARAAALQALSLDENLAEPHVTLARVLFWHDWDARGAERELRQAIQANPNCAMAHFHSGILFADLGRRDAAIESFQRAMEVDPVSAWNSSITAMVLCEIGEEEAGTSLLQKSFELDPSFFFTRCVSSLNHALAGRFGEAVAEAQEAVRLSAGLPLAVGIYGYVLAACGRRDEALATLHDLDATSSHRYVPAIARVWVYLGLGETDRAMEWVEQGVEQRDSQLPHMGVFRAFRTLDRYTRFQDVLRRIGIPLPRRSG
jgi:eukaryotic-like serine/threonine-protein kinase